MKVKIFHATDASERSAMEHKINKFLAEEYSSPTCSVTVPLHKFVSATQSEFGAGNRNDGAWGLTVSIWYKDSTP